MQTEVTSRRERPRFPVLVSGITGLGLMGAIGAIEGGMGGMIIAAFIRHYLIMEAAMLGACIAAMVGALVGFIGFIIAGEICQEMPDFRGAMKSVRGAAVRGSIIGMTLGGVMGMAAQWMVREHSDFEMAYVFGVTIGTTIGTLFGTITVAAREAFTEEDMPRAEHDAATDDTPQHDLSRGASITISL